MVTSQGLALSLPVAISAQSRVALFTVVDRVWEVGLVSVLIMEQFA